MSFRKTTKRVNDKRKGATIFWNRRAFSICSQRPHPVNCLAVAFSSRQIAIEYTQPASRRQQACNKKELPLHFHCEIADIFSTNDSGDRITRRR